MQKKQKFLFLFFFSCQYWSKLQITVTKVQCRWDDVGLGHKTAQKKKKFFIFFYILVNPDPDPELAKFRVKNPDPDPEPKNPSRDTTNSDN